jgi:hypothetical protein
MSDDLAVTFEYPNRAASQPVMSEAFRVADQLDVFHDTPPDGGPRITVIGEDTPEQRRELGRLRKILSANGGQERPCPSELHDRLRARRQARRR